MKALDFASKVFVFILWFLYRIWAFILFNNVPTLNEFFLNRNDLITHGLILFALLTISTILIVFLGSMGWVISGAILVGLFAWGIVLQIKK